MTIRTTAVAAFLMAVGTAAPANGQLPFGGTERTFSPAPEVGIDCTPRRTAGTQTIPTSSPAQIRQRLLYSGGEFSTFLHRSAGLAVRLETPVPEDSLDRQTEDRWFALDKAKHVTFSFLWTLSTQYVVVNKGRISEHHALPLSISSGAAIGVSKEYYDLTVGPTEYFSVKDLAADAVGILLAVGVILL